MFNVLYFRVLLYFCDILFYLIPAASRNFELNDMLEMF